MYIPTAIPAPANINTNAVTIPIIIIICPPPIVLGTGGGVGGSMTNVSPPGNTSTLGTGVGDGVGGFHAIRLIDNPPAKRKKGGITFTFAFIVERSVVGFASIEAMITSARS